MCYIKLVNEQNNVKYETPQDFLALLYYIFDIGKTFQDSVRNNPEFCGPYTGFTPGMLQTDYLGGIDSLYNYVMLNHFVNGKEQGNYAMHRIVSFDQFSYLLPQDLDTLGKNILRFYKEKGYAAAYAIHASTKNPHIHFVVDALSIDGRVYNLWQEYDNLSHIANCWYDNFQSKHLNPEMICKREKQIFYQELKLRILFWRQKQS